MKLYTAYYKRAGTVLFEGVSASELAMKLPPGARLIGGGEVRDKETGAFIRNEAHYKSREQDIVVYEVESL